MREREGETVPDIKGMARSGNGLVNGLAERSVPGRVVEHVQIRRRSQKGLLRKKLTFFFVFVFVFVDDDPLGVPGERVEPELERALGWGGAHGGGEGQNGPERTRSELY